MDPGIALVLAVLGVATGIFGSHMTLGNKITRCLTLLEGTDKRFDKLDQRIDRLEARPHFHRRASDQVEETE